MFIFDKRKEKWMKGENKLTKERKRHYHGDYKNFIGIKINGEDKLCREEIEGEISNEFYDELCRYLGMENFIDKIRYYFFDNDWTVDVFIANNDGLILAEIELESEDQEVELPDWIEEEVTNNEKYYNSYLAKYPYGAWENES